ncbi:iron complex outermembrane receptor protein [Chitinophaga skermanii]|uniref:Iron complex outermembrane receptor protein n=1 Tax=Chitinophaga skermanii TaxID=331697 RepID=A0A327R1Y8_9BACT|nr:TonB-dependent receptor [Chitinophaga skermanii]RAJ10869.1 iron complex outermembrane receptor protein [Chitinophaga skermanii]
MKKILPLFVILLVTSHFLNAQTLVKGIVKNAEGEPLIGATIVVKGTASYAVANTSGQFTIESKKEPPFLLLISFIGYKSTEVQVNGASEELVVTLPKDDLLSEVVITARRRKETLQAVPIPISVISGSQAEEAGAFNVNRLKELIPSVQLYSSNPRNTGLSIRGLGTTFGLTNDGIDPGVGFYVDGVYYARTAATTIDFIDVEQIEVLRGPQGTLFGKNTTAGTFNLTTKKPSFTPSANFELSYGNYGYTQAKSTLTGPISKKLAARLSFTGTHRDGTIYNQRTTKYTNTINNLGGRFSLLYLPSDKVEITFAADASRQRPDGYAQVFAGVAPTKRAAYQQFPAIAADLNYKVPSTNPFDRIIDHDTPWRSGQDFGGASVNVDIKVGSGTLTSTTAWRYWNWDPSNDRDFTGLQGLALSQAPSKHKQWSQEVRWAGSFTEKLSAVFGVFAFGQKLDPDDAHTEQAGKDQWRFSQNSTSELWKTPGLVEGYGIRSYPRLKTFSGAVFGQLDWKITKQLSLLPGIRFNYDDKEVDFKRETYGGLQTTDPALLALKNVVYSNQAFKADIDDTNWSGQLTLAYKPNDRLNAFATYSTGYKPVGLNLGGLPNASGKPMTELAVIKPEEVRHYEVGLKTSPTKNSLLNLTVYNTDIKDYQTQVQAADLSVNRGYLANAEKVRVRGVELDGNIKIKKFLLFYGAVAYTDGKYVSFKNAPPPLEETGGPTFKDVSGGRLPGVSKWAVSLGGEVNTKAKRFLGHFGEYFLAVDGYYRSEFSSSPSPSTYLVVDGYTLVNARAGFRSATGLSLFVWARNIFDTNYFEQLLPGAGNYGHYAGVLGDPRTFGITVRYGL